MKNTRVNLNKDIDFLASQRQLQEMGSSERGSLYFYLLILLGVVLIVGALTVKLKLDEAQLRKQIADLDNNLTNPTNVEKMTQASQLKNDISKLRQIKAMIEEGVVVLDEIGSFSIDPMVNAVSLKPAGISLDYFNYSNSLFSINAHATDYTLFSGYATLLQDSDVFGTVNYSGYVYDVTNKYYTVTYVCTMENGD